MARGCDRVSEPPRAKGHPLPLLGVPTAQEVGLLLPKSDPQTIKVPMGKEQAKSTRGCLTTTATLITDRSAGHGIRRWVSLMQMSLVSLILRSIRSVPKKDGTRATGIGSRKSARPSWNTSRPK